jgi:threonyl-tRNA synthetase
MGADCCGDSEKAKPACQSVTKDFGPANPRLAAHAETKSWDDIVKEKKSYYDHRVSMFEQIKTHAEAAVESARAKNETIAVTMPDGSQREGIKGVTTPMDIALGISKGLAKKSLVARVDRAVWDLMRPLEGNCSLELVTFDDPDGKDVRAVV